ncbi:MAG: hypothetical protein Q8K18_17655 [Burkholderiales bacterium]|nr:hypothetical protein [Burkholderiales bacterium]
MNVLKAKGGIWLILAAVVAVVFGLLTIRSGGAVLFGEGAARDAAGSYVPFVVWFNFLAGFAYIAAGVGFWLLRPWSAWLAVSITVATVIVFIAFGAYVLIGESYEMRTVEAMTLRTAVWSILAVVSCRLIGCRLQ